MKKYIRKSDIILFIVLVVLGLACTAYLAATKTAGDTVIIEKDGEVYGTYSLNSDTRVFVPTDASLENLDPDTLPLYADGNTVIIEDGKVSVSYSSCQHQVCVRHAAISRTGESIICLPHKLVVRIEGGGGYDAISR